MNNIEDFYDEIICAAEIDGGKECDEPFEHAEAAMIAMLTSTSPQAGEERDRMVQWAHTMATISIAKSLAAIAENSNQEHKSNRGPA